MCKLAHGSKQRGVGGGAAPPPPFANTIMLSSKLAQAGGWRGAAPPVCKHTIRMVNGAVSVRLILCMASLKHDTEAVKQACTRLKTAGGLGGRRPPAFAVTMLAWLVQTKNTCCHASLHKRGLGGAAPQFANILLAW